MSGSFMRYVPSVAEIKKSGTDTAFYMGPDFVRLPREVKEPMREWCGANLSSVALGKEGPDDDPIEVYVIPLGKNTEVAQFKVMLSDVLTKLVAGVTTSPLEDVFGKNSDAFFDTLRACAELRDFVLRVEGQSAGRSRAGTIKDPAILIEI
ncbi:MAG: hypothetical protein JWP57_4626 [Spirosoma sp.]|nr:hypothetical protein [Spirosoma sp.]